VTTYHVHVTREGDQWLADVPELDGASTYASNLTALDRYVREVIVLAADLPDSDMDELALDWSYNIGGDQLVEEANELRAKRAELAALEDQLEAATRALATKLTTVRGFSVRDTGPLLGISHQRVSQITPDKSAAAAPRKAAAAAKRTPKKAPAKTAAVKKIPAKKAAAKLLTRDRLGGPYKVVAAKKAPAKVSKARRVPPAAAQAEQPGARAAK
jgi:hypothetical protein